MKWGVPKIYYSGRGGGVASHNLPNKNKSDLPTKFYVFLSDGN